MSGSPAISLCIHNARPRECTYENCGHNPNAVPFEDPTSEMRRDPRFEAVWSAIKTWDINVPEAYVGYCGANGSHVRVILEALDVAAQYPDYPVRLGHISPGMRFEMINYTHQFMRLQSTKLDSDGNHLPIVDLSNGRVIWMHKTKPCRLVRDE